MTEQPPLGPKPTAPPVMPAARPAGRPLAQRPFLVTNIALVLTLATFALGFLLGRASAPDGDDRGSGSSSSANAADESGDGEAPEPVNDEPEPEPELELTPDDFGLKIRVTDKQCFGSAGCNIQYKVDLLYIGDPADVEGMLVEVTYKVTGDESGPQLGTISLDDGSYSVETRSASTSNSGVKLKAKATEVVVY